MNYSVVLALRTDVSNLQLEDRRLERRLLSLRLHLHLHCHPSLYCREINPLPYGLQQGRLWLWSALIPQLSIVRVYLCTMFCRYATGQSIPNLGVDL